MFLRAFLILAVVACLGAAKPRTAAYEIHPVIESGRLTALEVALTVEGEVDGETRLALPSSGMQDGEAAPYLRALRVKGGEAKPDGPNAQIVRHAPGARLSVFYRLVSGYDGDPPGQPFRPVVRPDWFVVHGQAAFVTVERAGTARLHWTNLPKDWIATSNLTPGIAAEKLTDSLLIGGTGWRKVEGRAGEARIDLYYREPGWQVSPAQAVGGLARVIAADFAYWGDKATPLFVPVIPIDSGDYGGRGLAGGFMIFAGADADLRDFGRILAHEHTHSWISRQVGGFPDVDDDLSAWFNEGFTEAFAGRSLLRSGLWSLEDFTADLNESLLRYGLSPEAEAPNRRILEAQMSNFDVGKLPYDRGRLLAIRWDRQIRAATSSRLGLDDVLQGQRRLAAANSAAGRRVPANELFPVAVRQTAGLDLTGEISAFIDHGRRIEMAPDLIRACGRFEEVEQPAFERGFNLGASLRNGGRVTELVPGGPAERAGLREGDRIRISEIPSRDSQKPLSYRVVDTNGGSGRLVSYKPEGQGTVRFQRFVLRPDMGAADRKACGHVLSGLK